MVFPHSSLFFRFDYLFWTLADQDGMTLFGKKTKTDLGKASPEGGVSVETRDVSGDYDHLLQQILAQFKSKAGKTVNAETALYSSAVTACVRVLAETMASLPLAVFRRDKAKRVAAPDYYLHPLLHDSPHPLLTAFEFIELGMGHLCLRGNFYCFKEVNRSGQILSLTPLLPQNMQVTINPDGKTRQYNYTDVQGKPRIFQEDEIWHLKGLSLDGILGVSPITIAREAIGLALAIEDYSARFYANDARPGGLLTSPGMLSPDAQTRLKKAITDSTTGENRFKLLVLEQGLKWESVGLSQGDAQFLETRHFQIEEIARVFRVPCFLIGHSSGSTPQTYASAEQFMLSFVTHTIRPWCVRWEKSINHYLISPADRAKGYFAGFNLDALLRGDTSTRFGAYSQAITARIMNPNECRAKENLPPYDGGDAFINPAIEASPKKGDES